MTANLHEPPEAKEFVDTSSALGRPRLLSVPEAAAYLGVSERWLYDQVRDGRLAAMYMARAWRIRPEVLDRFADSFAARPAPSGERQRGQLRSVQCR